MLKVTSHLQELSQMKEFFLVAAYDFFDEDAVVDAVFVDSVGDSAVVVGPLRLAQFVVFYKGVILLLVVSFVAVV